MLLAALDEKKSAAEINQQLNSPAFKAAIEELTVEAKIDLTQFTALSNYIKTGVIDVQALNAEMLKLKTTLNNLDPSTLNFESNINARKTMLTAAQDKYGMSGDLSVVKETIDPTTQLLDSITVEGIDKLDGSLRRISLTIVDGVVEPLNNIKIAPQLTKDLKDLDVSLNSSNKEIKNLIQLDKTRGDDAQRSVQIDDLITQNKNKILQMQTAINAAEQAGLISEETKIKLQEKITDLLTKNQNIRTNITSEIDEAANYKEAQVALSAYQKDYTELLRLKTKEQLEPDKFTDADRDRVQYLDQQIQRHQQLIKTYPPLIEQSDRWQKSQEAVEKQKFDNAEQQKVEKSVAELIKLYEDLYKAKNKVIVADSKGKSSADAQIEVDTIEQKINAELDYLQVTKQSAQAQTTAINGLSQAQQSANNVNARLLQRQTELQEQYEKSLETTYGTIMQGSKVDTAFAKIEKDLTTTSPSIQKFIKEVAGANGALRKMDTSTDSAGQQWLELDVIMNKTGDTMTVVKHSINETTGELRRGEQQIVKNVSRSMSFIQQVGHATKKMMTWGVAARLLYGSMRQVQEGFEFIKDLDKDITQAAIVTGKQRSEVQGLAQDYSRLALEMGKTVKEISKVNTELLRQGLTIQESAGRLDTIIKLSATGQITTEESLHVVTAAVNAMQESHVKAADVMLRASNISASSVEQLGEAFTKTASSAYATGMSIEETTGILATMLEVTQEGPSQLGTSLKTILARFSRVNEETGEFNEELNDVQAAVESVGIQFVGADGQIRSVYAILSDLSAIWPTLTKNQQAYVATTAAGVRMQNRFFAVMDNFDRVKTITEESGKSAGTMNRAYLTYLDSVEAATNRTQASLEQLWINTISPENIKMFYDAATAVINLVDKIGGLNIAVGGIVAFIANKTGVFSAFIKLFQTMPFAIGKLTGETVTYASALAVKAAALEGVNLGLIKYTTHLKIAAVEMLKFLAPYAAAIAAVAALGGMLILATKAYKEHQKQIEEYNQSLLTLNDTYFDQQQNSKFNKSRLQELGQEYENLSNKIEESGLSAEKALNAEEFQRYTQIQEELLDIVPTLATETDKYGNQIVLLKDGVKGLIDEYDVFVNSTADEFIKKQSDIIEAAVGDLEEYYITLERYKRESAKQPVTYSTRESNMLGVDTSSPTDMGLENRKKEAEAAARYIREKLQNGLEVFIAANESTLTTFQQTLLRSSTLMEDAIDQGIDEDSLENWAKGIIQTSPVMESFSDSVDFSLMTIESLNTSLNNGEIAYSYYNKAVDKTIDKNTELIQAHLNTLKMQKGIAQRGGADISALNAEIESIEQLIFTLKSQKQTQEEAAQSNTQLLGSYSKTLSEIESRYNKVTEALELNKKGYFQTAEGMEKLTEITPELLNYKDDEVLLTKKLTELLGEEDRMAQQTYQNMTMYSSGFYQAIDEASVTHMKNLAENYGLDLKEFANLAVAKAEIEANLLSTLSDAWDSYVGKVMSSISAGGQNDSMGEIQFRKSAVYKQWEADKDALDKEIADLIKDVKFDFTDPDSTGGSDDSKTAERTQIEIDLYAQLNNELEQIQSKYEEIDRLKDLADDDDLPRQIELLQMQNAVRQEEIDKLAEIKLAKESAMMADEALLLETGILKDRNNLADNYVDILQRINNNTSLSVQYVDQVKAAYENWLSGTRSEIIDLGSQIQTLIHQTTMAQNEIIDLSNQLTDAIQREAFAQAKSDKENKIQSKIDKAEAEIEAREKQIEQIEEQKDKLKDLFDLEKEALEEKIDALKEVAKIEDREIQRQEFLLNIEKQRLILENTKQNRNLQILTEEGQWDWVADPRQVAEEQENLANLESDYAEWQLDLAREQEEELIRLEINAATERYENEVSILDQRILSHQNYIRRKQTDLENYNKDIQRIQDIAYEDWLEDQEKWQEDFNLSTENFLLVAEQLYGASFAAMLASVLGLEGGYDNLADAIADVIRQMELLAELEGMGIPSGAANYTYTNSRGQKTDTKTAWTTGLGSATGEAAQRNVDRLKSDAGFRALEVLRAQKVIETKKELGEDTSAQEKYLKDIQAISTRAYGGEITHSGIELTKFHATKADPEWIFNSQQLDATLQRAVSAALNVSVPATTITEKINNASTEQIFNINKLEFPNVKDAEEIKQAILNLPNMAKMRVRTS